MGCLGTSLDNSSVDEDQYQFIVFDENDVEVNRFLLQWNEVSDTTGIKRKGPYTGHSRTSVWRMSKAAKGTSKITSFFKRSDCLEEDVEEDMEVHPGPKKHFNASSESLRCRLNEVNEILLKRGSDFSRRTILQYIAVSKYIENRISGAGKIQSSKSAANCLPDSCSRSAKCVLAWAKFFIETGTLPDSRQGKHQKTKSMMSDEDVEYKCIQWLRTCKKNERTPKKFARFVCDTLLPETIGAVGKRISDRTAERWMKALGYKYGAWKKGVYVDGHEREDVVIYRKVFLERMMERFKLMDWYDGDDMDITIEPTLGMDQDGVLEKKCVWVTHDESTFHANDDGGKGWSDETHPDLHKKGRGRCYMVSDYICPCHGRMYFIDDNGQKIFATDSIAVGKNHDGYWKGEDVVKQTREKAIRAFDYLHPGCIGIFTFDCSTNHECLPADALAAAKMNLKPGGAQPVMRNGWFIDDSGTRRTQSMIYLDTDVVLPELVGKPKGMRAVLDERGLLIKAERYCKKKGIKDSVIIDGSDKDCCLLHIMASQPDFMEQTSMLQEVFSHTNHVCEFFPKYHCELNPIECYWGSLKVYTRANCDYTWPALQQTVPKSFDSVPLPRIKRYFRRCWHYMQAYQQGTSIVMAEYAHKRYKSHRRIPLNISECVDMQ